MHYIEIIEMKTSIRDIKVCEIWRASGAVFLWNPFLGHGRNTTNISRSHENLYIGVQLDGHLRQHDAQGPAVTPLFNTLGFNVGPNITALQSFSCPKRSSSLELHCSGISLKLLCWYLNQCLPYHAQQKIQQLNKEATGFLFLISPHLCHGQKVFLLCASHQPSLYLLPC